MNVASRFRGVGVVFSVVVVGLLPAPDAQAAISGINAPVTSAATIIFDDTFSLDPALNPGITLGGPSVSPWSGATVSLPLTTDPVTLDTASGDIDAAFLGNAYAINFNNVLLNQFPTNTGTAHLTFNFTVEFQLDGAGLPAQFTLAPAFVVDGTVQNIPGSFAALGGFIDFIGVDTSGVYSVIETVNYSALWTAPGNFNTTVFGTPVNGSTPMLPANSTLTLTGAIVFQVDPASINAYTFQVPEPGTASMMVVGCALMLWWGTQRKSG